MSPAGLASRSARGLGTAAPGGNPRCVYRYVVSLAGFRARRMARFAMLAEGQHTNAPIAFRPVRLATIPFAVDAIWLRRVRVPVRAKRPCRASPAPGPGNHQGALARSGKPERTQRAIQRAKDLRAGVPLGSDRVIKSWGGEGRMTNRQTPRNPCIACDAYCVCTPSRSPQLARCRTRGARAPSGDKGTDRLSPGSARVPVRSRPLFAKLFRALLPTAKAEVRVAAAGWGRERAQ